MTTNHDALLGALMKYGCHNRTLRDSYLVQIGWDVIKISDGMKSVPIRVPVLVYYSDQMSRNCHYDRNSVDTKCQGCEHATIQNTTHHPV